MDTATAATMETEHSEAPAPYDFATPEFNLKFPVRSKNEEGRVTVTHKLRRPTLGQMIEYKKKIVVEQHYGKDGGQTAETWETAVAQAWLWDQIVISFSGYPDLDGETEATPENKAKMRGTHKQQAIDYLLSAEAEILTEESEIRFDGGEWVVLLKIGPDTDNPAYQVRFKLREWTERERRDFEKHAPNSKSKTEGGKTVSRSWINLKAFTDLFDALLQDVSGGAVNGKTLAEIGHDAFRREISGEYKARTMGALVRVWRDQLSDSTSS